MLKSEYSQCDISALTQRPGSGEEQWFLSLRAGGDTGLALSHAVTRRALPPLLQKPRSRRAVRSGRCVGGPGVSSSDTELPPHPEEEGGRLGRKHGAIVRWEAQASLQSETLFDGRLGERRSEERQL